MGIQDLALFFVDSAIQRAPVDLDPGFECVSIVALGIMQHEVGLQCLVAVFQIRWVSAAQLLLNAYRQARHENLSQTALVGNGCRRIELVTLIQPPTHGERGLSFGVVASNPGIAHGLQCRRQRDQAIGTLCRGLRGQLRQQVIQLAGLIPDVVKITAVIDIAQAPDRDQPDTNECHQGKGASPKPMTAPLPGQISTRQPLFRKHDFA